MTEISPGVHAIQLFGALGHIVEDDRLTLIDAGLPGSRRRLGSYLEAIGRSLDEVERIVCTHGHPDHVGGVRELAHEGVEVLIHPADYARMQVSFGQAVRHPSRGQLFAYFARTPRRASALEDGAVLPVLGGLEVIHTPGHTPGSVCLYAPRDRLLFVGDALEVRRGEVTYASPIFSDDRRAARDSVKRLAERDVGMIVFGHDPPWHDDANGVLRDLAERV